MSEEELDILPPNDGEGSGGDGHGPGLYVGTNGKQPNFLQKLYEFMALEPHPCPEIIYWAADSKQLVIAQPDKLAKEILPRLFKHDKLSSFGRQLNIYGFSRMFPGRQFKDAEGHVSDASVWSHPTLTRMSTPAEILKIKRRAAPKLFRTRRLANGEVVRTRAGPGVEAKFREVRDEMAESRRTRGLTTAEDEYLRSTGRSYAFNQDDPEQLHQHHSQRSRATGSPATPELVVHSTSLTHAITSSASSQRQQPAQQSPKHFWNRGRDFHNSHLESINEDAPSSWEIGFGGFIESAPVTATSAQVFAKAHDTSYRHATSFLNDHSPAFAQPPASPLFDHFPQDDTLPDNHLQELNTLSIAIQSCPASIHTSPVLRARDLPQMPTLFRTRMSWNGEVPPTPFLSLDTPQRSPSQAIHALQELETQQHQANSSNNLSQPPTPNSFSLSMHSPQAVNAFGHRERFASTMAAMSAASSSSSYDSVSPLHSARPSMIWDQGGIDPRLISPEGSDAGSAWSTPAATPRSGSPIQDRPSFSHYRMGGQY